MRVCTLVGVIMLTYIYRSWVCYTDVNIHVWAWYNFWLHDCVLCVLMHTDVWAWSCSCAHVRVGMNALMCTHTREHDLCAYILAVSSYHGLLFKANSSKVWPEASFTRWNILAATPSLSWSLGPVKLSVVKHRKAAPSISSVTNFWACSSGRLNSVWSHLNTSWQVQSFILIEINIKNIRKTSLADHQHA